MTYTYDTLSPGHRYGACRVVDARDVRRYLALINGDEPEAPQRYPEKAHRLDETHQTAPDILVLGLVSQVLGGEFPGRGTVVVSLSTLFVSRVQIGDPVRIQILIAEKAPRHRQVRVRLTARQGDRIVMAGEAVLLPPSEKQIREETTSLP